MSEDTSEDTPENAIQDRFFLIEGERGNHEGSKNYFPRQEQTDPSIGQAQQTEWLVRREGAEADSKERWGQIPRSPQALKKMEHRDYTVGWICALPTERAAAVAMLNERHDPLLQDSHDTNNYALGRIGGHNVVIACLPSGVTGTTSAATVASRILFTFPSIIFGLMVGVGGGAPSAENDIRLGDVVISNPDWTSGGMIHYDFGKTVQEDRFVRIASLNRPPDVLLNAMSTLQANHLMEEPQLTKYLSEMVSRYPRMKRAGTYQGVEHDLLFKAEYNHQAGEETCSNCDLHQVVPRSTRSDNVPAVHYGLIASANHMMRNGVTRERLRKELNVLCFEMEAAGLIDNFPCLVIRGICDYADTHKNNRWQPYAAAVAAAYAKELLCVIPANNVVHNRTVMETRMKDRE